LNAKQGFKNRQNERQIRWQFLPKKTNFDFILDVLIANIKTVINNSPLKSLDWASPSQLLLFNLH